MNINAVTILFGSLFWFVGLSSWLTITALFSELSLMINCLPEGYEIFSYLALIIQFANITPLIYSCIPKSYKTLKLIEYLGCIIIAFSFISMLFMAYHYTQTITIGSSKHSIMLFIATFCASTCDCMTSMIFWRWVAYYPSQYIAFLSAGEPSSGIIASILIWIQQLNINITINKPRFSVQTYLLVIASLLPLSFISFIILNKLLKNGYFALQKDWIDVSISNSQEVNDETGLIQSHSSSKLRYVNHSSSHSPADLQHIDANRCCYCFGVDFLRYCKRVGKRNSNSNSSSIEALRKYGVTKYESMKWVSLVAVISAIQNGVIPSVSSYALIPYNGNIYVYAIALSNILRPFMAIITAYLPNILINMRSIIICCIGWCLCTVYIFYIATLSPYPIGQSDTVWMILIIITFVLCQTLLTLSKTCVIMMVKKEFMFQSRSLLQININLKTVWDRQIGGVMERIGLGIQIGSFCGALLLFVVVNLIPIHLFKS